MVEEVDAPASRRHAVAPAENPEVLGAVCGRDGGAAWPTVANAHAVMPSSCGLKSCHCGAATEVLGAVAGGRDGGAGEQRPGRRKDAQEQEHHGQQR